MLNQVIKFFLENKVVAWLLLLLFIGWGLSNAPFDFGFEHLPRNPVSVDAIPDIGENQQIVFTQWKGRSPQDVEDQITYPLTSALLGIPGVKSIRSNSMFGFSSIYIIFSDDVEFYWSRSRILEKLNALPPNTLPDNVQPMLGPDATALGQIFWYTLEGRDRDGHPTGGWDLQELRTIQDFYVRYGLSSAEGVSEVASIGGFVKEYQVDVDPEKLKSYDISLEEVMSAIRESNLDIGAQTIEINMAEYFVRGLGYVRAVEDIEESVVTANDNVPIRIRDLAKVSLGPASRRGILDKSGAEAVGGVVVARYGSNPLAVIDNVKKKIDEISPGLPSKTLADGTESSVRIIPFYDRTQLINETIGTLQEALTLEILITIIVVILMLFNLKSSILVSGSLPVAVLMCFIAMKSFGVDANIVALSGIAIAIGTMVDMGIVMTESMVNRIKEAPPGETLFTTIYEASVEVASAVITAVATTIISFLPVFTMEAAEGKLFRPLAFTKTFALIASIIVAITILPPLAHSLFSLRSRKKGASVIMNITAVLLGVVVIVLSFRLAGFILILAGLSGVFKMMAGAYFTSRSARIVDWITNVLYALIVAWLLAVLWMPLGVNKGDLINFLFIVLIAGILLLLFVMIIHFYETILRFLLKFKIIFLLVVGIIVWQGFEVYSETGEEFMPALDEGSFLLMPTSMPHSGMQENLKNLRLLDMAVTAIPEVETVVGKAGRVNSALDPAPMSMYENVILYKSEYKTDSKGHRIRYKYENGDYVLDDGGSLIPDKNGRYFRQWRDEIKSPDDIWNEIVRVTKIPGVTSAPKLQPIETRLVMLQTGMRAPMGIKVYGTDLSTIESFGIELEQHLKNVDGVKEAAVFADRIIGKPYLLLDIDRKAVARHGLTISMVQNHIQAAVGGMPMTTTVEGRERYSIRVRYPRELRDDPDALKRIYISTRNGQQILLGELVDLKYEQGAQSIKSEDGFLVGYVLFDREGKDSEVEVVHKAQQYLNALIESGELKIPEGISYKFTGNYEQQVRASKRLALVIPIALAIIFLILYFQFKSVLISLMVFTGVFIAFSGGFIMIGLYDTDWFLNFDFLGVNMRDLFQIKAINLSVAVWVGFLALFGIATDDGVLVATFLRDSFRRNQPDSISGIRDAIVEGGLRRVRPAMMTTATTLLALIPVLTSTGRGADIMVPMAIPSFGGMTLQIITMFTVPVLYSLWQEWKFKIDRSSFSLNKSSMKTIAILAISAMCIGQTQAQSLPEHISLVQKNNLLLQSLENEYLAAMERGNQVSQLPDPEGSIGIFPMPVETRLGAQVLRLSGVQMFPWFGTLKARRELEEVKANIKLVIREIAERDVILALKKNYFELYRLRESQAIVRRNIELLEVLERLALSNIESGKGTTADVLRVQLKIEALTNDLIVLRNKERRPLSTLNQIMNRPVGTPVQIADKFAFAILPPRLDSAGYLIRSNDPVFRMFKMEEDVALQMIKLNEFNGKPTFGGGFDYIMVDGRNDLDPPGNGRDIVQLRANVTIPINRTKYEAREREELYKIKAVRSKAENTISEYESIIEMALADYDIAAQNLDLFEKQKSLTQKTIDILETAYSANGEHFDELLRLEQELIGYDLDILDAIVRSHLAKSQIERFFEL